MPFCTTKTLNFLLVTRYFYGGSVVCDYQRFCFLCSCSLLFFHCRSFSPCWPLAFLIFSPPLWNFHVFFQRNSSPLFSITCSISFSVIHVSVNIKLIPYKKTRLCCCFFFLKVRAAMRFPSKENLDLHLGCHTCSLSYFDIGISVLWTDGWTYGHVITKIYWMEMLLDG